MKKYEELFKEADINNKESQFYLTRFKAMKLVFKVMGALLIVYFIYAAQRYGGGDAFVYTIFATIFIGFPLGILPLFTLFEAISKLEKIYFDEFLSKKIKIFYSSEELDKYTFNIIKESNIQGSGNNQALMNACEEAYKDKAEAILIVSTSLVSTTSGKINRGSGEVESKLIDNLTVRFLSNLKIKDTQELNRSSEFDKKLDLDYWYGLYEKGAINQDEYQKKKDELL